MYTEHDKQSAPAEEKFEALVSCFISAAEACGLIQGQFNIQCVGKKIFKVSIPCLNVVGGELNVGMAIGHFIGQVETNKLFNKPTLETGIEKFNPMLVYLSLHKNVATKT